jgi:signal transduction histidine kinase
MRRRLQHLPEAGAAQSLHYYHSHKPKTIKKGSSMRWSRLRKWAISLPAAFLAAAVLIGINEAGYYRSHDSLQNLTVTYQTRTTLDKLMQQLVDAETHARGYLLSGEDSNLADYQQACTNANNAVDELRAIYSMFPEDLQTSSMLGREVAKRLSQMNTSIALRREGLEEAWRFLVKSPEAKATMENMRKLSNELVIHSNERRMHNEAEILKSLTLARLGIAMVSIVGLLAFYLYLRQSNRLTGLMLREQRMLEEERDQLEKQVRQRTAILGELATHLQQVREDERAHLARELHDELGALLTTAKLDVARLKSKIDMTAPDVQERIKHLIETLNSGIALKRNIIENLRPSSLSNLGLTASLEILAKEFSESSNVAVELSLEQINVPEAMQLSIYRLIQESLTNIGKYAQASHVLISLQSHPQHVFVQVRDDGIGFDPSQAHPNSHGLAGMRHRIEASGGRLHIASAPQQGTTISANLPQN